MNNLFVRDAARDALTSFLADVVDLIHWTPDIGAFSMNTKIGYYFPGLVDFLHECPIEKTACLSSEVNVDRFLFHLEHLKVSPLFLTCFIYIFVAS